MSRVKVTTVVGERLTTVEVDRAVLTRVMQVSNIFGRALGIKPGEQRKTQIITADGRQVEKIISADKRSVDIAIELGSNPKK